MNVLAILADAWGYTLGGINVFNREMCRGFSKYISSQIRVICIAPNIPADEISYVKEHEGLELISITEAEFQAPGCIVSAVRKHCDSMGYISPVVTWLGHDTYSDYQALECRKLWAGSKCAIIHHMSYRMYYPLENKDVNKILEKERSQRERLNAADIVFANGPLLKKSAMDLRGGRENVFEILPGIF